MKGPLLHTVRAKAVKYSIVTDYLIFKNDIKVLPVQQWYQVLLERRSRKKNCKYIFWGEIGLLLQPYTCKPDSSNWTEINLFKGNTSTLYWELLMFSIFEIGSRNQYVSIKHRVCICTPLIYLYPSHLSYSINWYAASIYPCTMKIRVRLIVEIYYPFNVRLICKKVFQRLKKKHNKVSVVQTSFIMVEIACNWLKLK